MLAINDSNFEEMVINSQIPVLLDFWDSRASGFLGTLVRPLPHDLSYR